MTSEVNAAPEALLIQAEALGIPWKAILLGEILAEKTLQRGLPESPEWPLACAFALLPISLLRSWRVRERLDRLSWEATAERSREAAGQLRALYFHLTGRQGQRPPVDFLSASHLWLGYRRVLELLKVARAADRSRGSRGARVEAVVRRARCVTSDAQWAVDRVDSCQKSHNLDDAMGKTREEGFELPHARSAPEAFLLLKRFLLRRGFLPARRGRPPLNARHFGAGNDPRERGPSPGDPTGGVVPGENPDGTRVFPTTSDRREQILMRTGRSQSK